MSVCSLLQVDICELVIHTSRCSPHLAKLQHSTAQHSTAQHSTAQHSTGLHVGSQKLPFFLCFVIVEKTHDNKRHNHQDQSCQQYISTCMGLQGTKPDHVKQHLLISVCMLMPFCDQRAISAVAQRCSMREVRLSITGYVQAITMAIPYTQKHSCTCRYLKLLNAAICKYRT